MVSKESAELSIVDIAAWTGHWSSFPVPGGAEQLVGSLKGIGVDRICLSPLDSVWCHNPHICNRAVYEAAERFAEVEAVPVVDPTIPTWEEEIELAREKECRLVRLVPAYAQYEPDPKAAIFEVLERIGMGVVVQIRIEDPRRNHPLAMVMDCPIPPVAEVARAHPELPVVLGGATWRGILETRDSLLKLPHFYADVSQADGVDSLRIMVEAGLGEKLLFGTHAPLFVPQAGLARVVTDLEEKEIRAILGENGRRLLARGRRGD